MLENAKWYLGAGSTKTVTTNTQYTAERSTTSSKICTSGTYCNDTVPRNTSWVGMIGLMYPTDYGYAAGSTCDAINLSDFDVSCKDTDWLFNSAYNQWTLASRGISSYANHVFAVYSVGRLDLYTARYSAGLRPTTYLKSNIKISGGKGTSSDPYQLGL